MRPAFVQVLTMGLAGLMVLAASDASARHKKPRQHAPAVRNHVRDVPSITRDFDGTPIIMQGFHRTRPAPLEEPTMRADRPVNIPRGSSTYIPPPVPSPYSPNSPPPAALLQPPPSAPPAAAAQHLQRSGDDAIHDFPLQRGSATIRTICSRSSGSALTISTGLQRGFSSPHPAGFFALDMQPNSCIL